MMSEGEEEDDEGYTEARAKALVLGQSLIWYVFVCVAE